MDKHHVHHRLSFLALFALIAMSASAAAATPSGIDASTERLIRAALPICSDEMTLKVLEGDHTWPAGMSGTAFRIESSSPYCGGQYSLLKTARGNFYVGAPWPLGKYSGTPEQKLRAFAWEQFHETFTPVIDSKKNEDGLLPVQMLLTTEQGKVPLEGWIDTGGTFFYLGNFFKPAADPNALRLESLGRLVSKAPSKGTASAKISLIEFSDFQCPSCKMASSYLDPIFEKYGDQIHYTRIDLPLMSAHPWAFAAALFGRAIHRQKPENFWDYRSAVYENQANLNIFTIEEFARGFATDHALDMAKFDADVASADVRQQILDGVGTAYTMQLNSTPSFLVNGSLVTPGVDGKNLERVVAQALGTAQGAEREAK